jgi:surface antigen
MLLDHSNPNLALSFCLLTAILTGCAGGPGSMADGSYLDQYESRQLTTVTQQAAEEAKPGERVGWEHKDVKSGLVTTVGWVEPKSESYVGGDGEVCRDLEQVVLKGGERHVQMAKACRKTAAAGQPAGDGWAVRQS